jgi:hypothetical protein
MQVSQSQALADNSVMSLAHFEPLGVDLWGLESMEVGILFFFFLIEEKVY